MHPLLVEKGIKAKGKRNRNERKTKKEIKFEDDKNEARMKTNVI